jgi:NitT/TauT family transport system ATP-binding protein
VTRPDLLLMDEPFGALDELTRQRLNEELLGLWERDKWTCLFVTHNVFEAVFMSERVIVMKPRPGSIATEIEVPLEYPRRPELRAEPEFARVVGEVSAALREHGE